MSLHVEIPEPLAGQVADAAKSRGASPEELVLQAVADSVDPLARLRKLAGPIADRLQQSSQTMLIRQETVIAETLQRVSLAQEWTIQESDGPANSAREADSVRVRRAPQDSQCHVEKYPPLAGS